MGTLPGEPLWISTNYQRGAAGNRSPVESPPVAKKLLKSGATMPPTGLRFLPADSPPSTGGKENRSILKRDGATGTRSKSWCGPLRKVNFEASVAVVVYDPTDGDYVCSASQQLNVEPGDRREFVNRTLMGRRAASVGSANQVGGAVCRTADSSSSSGRPLPPSSSQEHTPDVDFAFYEDLEGQLRLKFTVPLGPGVAAGDALVKANVSGTKVRVLATRTLTQRDATGAQMRQQFASRFSLPMDVDPYGITARMDGNGNLFVEAPVMTTERRRTLSAEKAVRTPASASTNTRLA